MKALVNTTDSINNDQYSYDDIIGLKAKLDSECYEEYILNPTQKSHMELLKARDNLNHTLRNCPRIKYYLSHMRHIPHKKAYSDVLLHNAQSDMKYKIQAADRKRKIARDQATFGTRLAEKREKDAKRKSLGLPPGHRIHLRNFPLIPAPEKMELLPFYSEETATTRKNFFRRKRRQLGVKLIPELVVLSKNQQRNIKRKRARKKKFKNENK